MGDQDSERGGYCGKATTHNNDKGICHPTRFPGPPNLLPLAYLCITILRLRPLALPLRTL